MGINNGDLGMPKRMVIARAGNDSSPTLENAQCNNHKSCFEHLVACDQITTSQSRRLKRALIAS